MAALTAAVAVAAASAAGPGVTIPYHPDLQSQLLSLPGVCMDCSGGPVAPPLYSRLLSPDPDAARIARSGAWRSFVVGNNKYREGGWAPLTKCVNDAEDMGAALASKGHAVTMVLNATREQLACAFSAFASNLPPACTVVLFFSGHGCAASGVNFLVPVDGDPNSVAGVSCAILSHRVPQSSLSAACLSFTVVHVLHRAPLNALLETVYHRVTTGAVIVLLDACREPMHPLVHEYISPGLRSPE